MTSNEVLAMYENIAVLTGKMANAAQAGDMQSLAAMEVECARHSAAAAHGVPALEAAPRMRKIDLLKQIMANDRAIRAVTEPWELSKVMATH
ncbi:flagellar protein FliT [Massilia sp. CF038]|uniref:flagellar protein FliT n=1 Tax=Massilia sp. CF038 TaxID=1881045 RepID=UPI00091BCC64|nr:flagellar protein FliT [Massilia sp. CF038]SHH16417.1 flagellar protein FliT [Massilia sp. CF038]